MGGTLRSPCLQRFREVNQLPCHGCGVVAMILPKPHLVGSRRQKNDSAFNDSAFFWVGHAESVSYFFRQELNCINSK